MPPINLLEVLAATADAIDKTVIKTSGRDVNIKVIRDYIDQETPAPTVTGATDTAATE